LYVFCGKWIWGISARSTVRKPQQQTMGEMKMAVLKGNREEVRRAMGLE
jgi:hypothetical protein